MGSLVERVKRDEYEFMANHFEHEFKDVELDETMQHFIREAFLYGYQEGHIDGMNVILSSGKCQQHN